jgi:hypothetical protein
MHQYWESRFFNDIYESDACFSPQPGQFIKAEENIRQSMQRFVDMQGKSESKI